MLSTIIIGAGPAGLVAAKECLEAGIHPILFEKKSQAGGVWHHHYGKTWHTMKSNLSRFHLGFSDFPWPAGLPDYPTNQQISDYLDDYALTHGLYEHVYFNSNVTAIDFNTSQKSWRLELSSKQKICCKHLIIANGYQGKANVPPNFLHTEFTGTVLHSEHYKNSTDFSGKKVVVVGGGASGYEIASDLAQSGNDVAHVFTTAAWITTRYMKSSGVTLPFDLLRYHFPIPGKKEDPISKIKEEIKLYKTIYGNPGDVHKDLYVSEDPHIPFRSVICDDYAKLVSAGKVEPYKDKVESVVRNGIILKSGKIIKAEVIILCTGYSYQLPICNVDFNFKNNHLPLYNYTSHQYLNKSYFIGAFKGSFWGIMELQARWVASLIQGVIAPPASHIRSKKIVDFSIRSNFSTDCDYAKTMCSLSTKLNAFPTDLLNRNQTGQMPFIPADFRRTGIGAKPTIAIQQREQLEKRISAYMLNPN